MKKHVHKATILGEHYLKNIMKGKKRYEGRVNTQKYRDMRPGDQLELYENHAKTAILCEIIALHPFNSFKEMLKTLGVLTLLPQLEKEGMSEELLLNDGVKVYEAFPGSERVTKFGCVAIEVRFLREITV